MFHNFLLYWPALIISLRNACHHTFRASYSSLKISSKSVCNMPANTVPGRKRKLVYTTNISYLLSLCRSFSWHVPPTLHFFPETGFGDLVYWFAPGRATCMLSCNAILVAVISGWVYNIPQLTSLGVWFEPGHILVLAPRSATTILCLVFAAQNLFHCYWSQVNNLLSTQVGF